MSKLRIDLETAGRDSPDICVDCGNKVDPELCHCGGAVGEHPWAAGHEFVPGGCTCGYSGEYRDVEG